MGEGKRRVCDVDDGGSQQRSRPNYCLRCLGLRSKPHGVAGLAKKICNTHVCSPNKVPEYQNNKSAQFCCLSFQFHRGIDTSGRIAIVFPLFVPF